MFDLLYLPLFVLLVFTKAWENEPFSPALGNFVLVCVLLFSRGERERGRGGKKNFNFKESLKLLHISSRVSEERKSATAASQQSPLDAVHFSFRRSRIQRVSSFRITFHRTPNRSFIHSFIPSFIYSFIHQSGKFHHFIAH